MGTGGPLLRNAACARPEGDSTEREPGRASPKPAGLGEGPAAPKDAVTSLLWAEEGLGKARRLREGGEAGVMETTDHGAEECRRARQGMGCLWGRKGRCQICRCCPRTACLLPQAELTARGHLLGGNLTELGTLCGHRQHRLPGQHRSEQSPRDGGIGSGGSQVLPPRTLTKMLASPGNVLLQTQ